MLRRSYFPTENSAINSSEFSSTRPTALPLFDPETEPMISDRTLVISALPET